MFEHMNASMKGNVNYNKTYSEISKDLYQTDIDKEFSYAINLYNVDFQVLVLGFFFLIHSILELFEPLTIYVK